MLERFLQPRALNASEKYNVTFFTNGHIMTILANTNKLELDR